MACGLLDDSLNHAVDRRIVPALEAGNLERHQVRMPRGKLRRPYFVICAAGIRIFPSIADAQRMTDHPSAHLVAEQPLQHVIIQRQRVLGEDGIAQLLELLHDLVIQSRIVVIGPPQHHDADAVLAFELVENFAGLSTDAGFVVGQSLVSHFHRTIVFLLR